MQRFDAEIVSAVDKLGALHRSVEVVLNRNHDVAKRDYERSQWLAGIAAAVTALLISRAAEPAPGML